VPSIDLGADLPALRPPADDHPARDVRPRAVRTYRFPRGSARCVGSAALIIAAGWRRSRSSCGGARRPARGGSCPIVFRNRAWLPAAVATTLGGVRGRRTWRQSARTGWRCCSSARCRSSASPASPHGSRSRRSTADVPGLALDRAQAVARADEALATRGVKLGPEWRRLSVVKLASDDGQQWSWHKFIWREKGADAYRSLIGNALPPRCGKSVTRRSTATSPSAPRNGVSPSRRRQHRTSGTCCRRRAPVRRPTREAAAALATRNCGTAFGLDPAGTEGRSPPTRRSGRNEPLELHVHRSGRRCRPAASSLCRDAAATK